jgi:purine catabolism regulator
MVHSERMMDVPSSAAALPTLRQLASALAADLEPVGARGAPDVPVSGVHVSELADPTVYLSGGELLLTTGMSLTGRTGQARAYVARLVRSSVAGLGIGLGPVHQVVPAAMVRACDDAGLPLFVIPAPTPFLTIARSYWGQVASAGQAELNASLGAHRALITATRRPDPVAALLRVLADGVRGWAAQLDRGGAVGEVWPISARDTAARVREEIGWMRAAGPHASAAFSIDDGDVVVQPLSRGDRAIGFLATGATHRLQHDDRQMILAAGALLALQLDQRDRERSRRDAERSCVLLLALDGRADAGRALAADLRHRWIGTPAVLIAVAAAPELAPEDLAGAQSPQVWWARKDDALWLLAESPAAQQILAELEATAGSGPLRAASGRVTSTSDLPAVQAALRARLGRLAPGQVVDRSADVHASRAADQVARLAAYPSSDLAAAVGAYLAHQRRWDAAAQSLGVHRNTLRQRLARAVEVADLDLDDPDQASHLWIALSDRGFARR